MSSGNAIVGALSVFLGLDDAEFDSALDKSVAKAKAKGGQIGSALGDGFGRSSKSIAAAEALAVSFGGAIVGAGAAALVGARGAMAYGASIKDLASNLRVSTDYLQSTQYAAKTLGGEFDDGSEAIRKFKDVWDSAKSGLSKADEKPFKALGIDPKDFDTVEQAINAVVAKIEKLKSVSARGAIAEKLGVTALVPSLHDSAEALDDIQGRAAAAGGVMRSDLVSQAGDLNDQFEELTRRLDTDMKSALLALGPLLTGLLETTVDWIEKLGDAGPLFEKIARLNPAAAADADEAKHYAMVRSASGIQSWLNAKVDRVRPGAVAAASNLSSVRTPPTETLKPTGKPDHSAARRAEASEQAIYQAQREELAARMALTGDIAKLAALRTAEVDAETQRRTARLTRDAAEGKITDSAAKLAIGKLQEAATQQKALITREAEEQAARDALAQEQYLAQARGEIATITASLAKTAQERAQVEARALSDRQAIESKALQQDLSQQVARGEITEAQAQEKIFAQQGVQAAQRRQQDEAARVALVQQQAQLDQAEIQNQIDLLGAQADAAETETERAVLRFKMLDLQEQLERAQLEEIIQVKGSASTEGQIAAKRLAILKALSPSEEQRELELLRTTYGELTGALDDLRTGIDRHDWGTALGGLFKSIQTLQNANNSTATQIGAIAGLANGVGQMVGGKAGGALSGAAQGAMAGAAFGAPGAIVGGILGGLGGLFGASKAKKQAKRQAEEKAAQEAAAKALQISNERRALEIELLEAQGKSEEAEAERHKDYIASLDASNRAVAEQVYQQQKLTDAANAQAEQAAKVADARETLQDRIDKATLSSAELAEKAHDKERAQYVAIDASLGAMVDQAWSLEEATAAALAQQAALEDAYRESARLAEYLADAAAKAADEARQQIGDARNAAAGMVENAQARLVEAYQREADALRDTAQKFRDLSASLKTFRQDLQGETAGGGGGLEFLRARVADLGRRMQLGDAEAAAQFQDVAKTFLDASRDQSASTAAFMSDRDWILQLASLGEATADRTATNADAQLSALQATVGQLVRINDSVQTVAEAIQSLKNTEANAAYLVASSSGAASTADIPAFANGGSFQIGGFGGTDSQVVAMRATPGELVNVTHGGGSSMADVVAAIAGLGERMSRIETNTYGTRRLLGRWLDGDAAPKVQQA